MEIRPATVEDISTITDIYNDAILHTDVVWSDDPVDVEDRIAWLHAHEEAGEPVFVAVDPDLGVVGFATYGQWRPFAGYRHTVEHSVYVRSDARGQGLGRRLLTLLIDHARENGIHAMVAGIAAGNFTSLRLHEAFGFRTIGTFPQVGVKFGQWLDLTMMELVLDDDAAPEPVA